MMRWVVVGLAVARATRFVTSDSLGEWVAVGRLKRWAARSEAPEAVREDVELKIEDEIERGLASSTPPEQWGWRSKLVKGLDCPFCVGFWIGLVAVAGELLFQSRHSTRPSLPGSALRSAWKVGTGAFALNYLVGHVSKRLD